jgi:N utilization substance protein A
MAADLFQAIEQIGREKGIDVNIIIEAVEDAYVAASRKVFRSKEELSSRFNKEDGTISVFAVKRVVEEVENEDLEISLADGKKYDPHAVIDSLVEIPKPTAELGRIAAQAAKQVLYQKVREAERENVYREFSERIGEIVNGIVKRFERGDVIVDLGRTEAALQKKEVRKFLGQIEGFAEGKIVLSTEDGGTVEIPLEDVARARLEVEL